ncbi:MAG: S-layer homology domain-containing protein, partial [Oscillospiraceae bacterium]
QVDMNTNGILNFSYKMSIKEGEYTVRVLNGKGSEIYKTTVYYLPENVKINIFESVRSATSKNDVLDIIINNINKFTKYSELFEMAKPNDYDTVAIKLFAKKDEILTFDDMINLIDDTLILKVLCTTIDSGEVLKLINDYSHVLGLNNTEAYKTYQSAYVTEDIKSLIVSRLLKSDVDTIEKWRQRFNETVLISTIEKTGYKDIMSVLTLNPSLGLNFSEYYKLSYDEKILVHTAFAGIKYASLADVKANFDIAVINVINNRKEPSKPSNNGGGGGGNGGGMNGEVSVNGGQASIPDPTPTDDIFIDINDVLWAKDSIENLYKLKIINGKSDKIFEPLSNVTRAEFLKMLMISLDLVDETATSDFKDVEKADWFYTYIASAQKLGITTGKSEIEFGVDDNISREEIAVFVDRALKIPTPNEDEIIFLDADSISEFAKKSVARLQNTNIVKGDENNCFNPLDFATRAETAVIINRLLNL